MLGCCYRSLRDILHDFPYRISPIPIALLNRWAHNATIEIKQRCGERSCRTNRKCLQITISMSAHFQHDLLRTQAVLFCVPFADLIDVIEKSQFGKYVAGHENVEGTHSDIEERFYFGNDLLFGIHGDQEHYVGPKPNRRRDGL